MLVLRRGCGNPARSDSPAVQQFLSETLGCARRSGWWFSTPSAAIRGCVSNYERLRAAGKPGKVAVIAAMRKLLTAVWSVATHRNPFEPHLPGEPAPLGAVTNEP